MLQQKLFRIKISFLIEIYLLHTLSNGSYVDRYDFFWFCISIFTITKNVSCSGYSFNRKTFAKIEILLGKKIFIVPHK